MLVTIRKSDSKSLRQQSELASEYQHNFRALKNMSSFKSLSAMARVVLVVRQLS
jgi:hypothetical protein